MMNYNELTVVVLKEQAKALGIKGAYKMKKAELIEALNTVEVKGVEETMENNTIINNGVEVEMNGVVEMEMNKGLVNNELKEKEVVNMNKLNERLARLVKEGNVDGIVKMVGRRNSKAFKMIKEASKDMKVVGSYQVVFRVDYNEENDVKSPYLVVDLAANVGLGSNITRAAMTKFMKIADKSMVLNIEGTTEIISINLDDSLFLETENKNLARQLEEIRTRVFSMLKGGDITKRNRESLNIVFSDNGLARVEFNANAEVKEDEVMKQYKFLGVSPSGLRSKSFQAASVKIKTFKHDGFVDCDRRTYLLNESVDGCMDDFIENNEFRDLKSKAAQFKNATRITMGTPGSKVVGEISNMIVFDNIAAGAKFNGKAAHNTCDGNTIACAEYAHARLVEAGVPVSLADVVGVCEQVRGAGLKASTIYELREDLVTLIRHLLSSDSKAEVAYVIVDGVRYSSWTEVYEAGKAVEFFNNVELVADTNAMKITAHRDRFNLVRLKTAYQSNMNLSMVTAMAMLVANEAKASKLLLNKSIAGIAKKFKQLGVKFEYENGMVNGVELDLEGLKALNNEAQFMSYLLKCDPAKTIAMFPGVVRSEFANIIKGIAKTISKAEIELENSTYTVVQADKGVIFGTQILDEHEMFCHTLPSGIEVAITRHPISALNAVTILKTVSLEEVIERILATDLSIDKKMFLINYYGRSNQWCIIPASHRLMEKHDGMDFDIDAVQIIADQDVVEILKELKDRGSVIKDTPEADADRHTETPEEKAIVAAQKNRNVSFARPQAIKSESTTEVARTSRVVVNRKKNNSKKFDLSFDAVCSLSKEYYSTTIAGVGVIANAFYVNGLILSTLKSESVDMKVKEAITKAFKMYYRCNGNKDYVSTVDRDAEIYEVEKKDCSAAVFRFAESNGTLNSLITYLEDCCDYNRYLAETSIDSAKNNFFIINMFNHGRIVSPKGAKQNCKVVLKEANETFAQIANAQGETENNFFELELLQFQSTGLELNEWLECGGMKLNKYTNEMEQVSLAVEDALYLIKEESRIVANELIVLASKLLEDEILSDYAVELRNSITTEASAIVNGRPTAHVIDSVSRTFTTLTLALKENNADEKTSDEIEGISKVEYLKTVAINGIKNFARHALSDLTSLEIGAIICNELVKGVSNENCKAINSAFYKIFADEMVEFLSEVGFDNVGFIGEEISYAHVDSVKVNVADFVGTIVSVNDGQAEIEDTVLVMKNKRTSLTGSIVEIDGRFFVKAVRENSEVVAEHGMYLNVNKKFDKYCVDISNVDVLGYRFKAKQGDVYSGIYAFDAQDKEYLVAAVSGREEVTKILKNADLSNISIMTHTSEKGYTSRVVYLPGVDYINAVEAINNIVANEEMFDMDFSTMAPVDFNMEGSLDFSAEDFDATDLQAPEFDFNGFGICE